HPCIALWCGNNEIDEGWKNWGWQKQFHYSEKDSARIWNDYLKLFHQLIPNFLDSLLSPFPHLSGSLSPRLPVSYSYESENRRTGSSENLNYLTTAPQVGGGQKDSLMQRDSHHWA